MRARSLGDENKKQAKIQATNATQEIQNAVIASDKAQISEQEAKKQATIATQEKQNAVIASDKAQKS